MRGWLIALGHWLRMQATSHSHEKSRSNTSKGPGIMPRRRRENPAGTKLWRKAEEGKL